MTAHKILLAGALILGGSFNVALAQGGGGYAGSWVVHTPDKPNCPGIDLHVARNGSELGGTASTGSGKQVSRVAGTIDGSSAFKMTMTPIDPNGPKGTIQGKSEPEAGVLTATIAGSGCTDG